MMNGLKRQWNERQNIMYGIVIYNAKISNTLNLCLHVIVDKNHKKRKLRDKKEAKLKLAQCLIGKRKCLCYISFLSMIVVLILV